MGRQASSTGDVCLYFLAIFISPISVLVKRGCGADFIINIALFLLGWIPGVIHAWWIISKYETPADPAQPRGQPVYYNKGPSYS